MAARYQAVINTPGYLPWDDDPPEFATAEFAWSYLAGERRYQEDAAELEVPTETVAELDARSLSGGTGTVYGSTPDRELSEHDLGIAYSVTETEEESS